MPIRSPNMYGFVDNDLSFEKDQAVQARRRTLRRPRGVPGAHKSPDEDLEASGAHKSTEEDPKASP